MTKFFHELKLGEYFRFPGIDSLFEKIDYSKAKNHGGTQFLNKPIKLGRKGQTISVKINEIVEIL